jgi:radical SAM superfamily enzyme YgiQ (UPF0313 family)
MKEAGCFAIQIGIECWDEKVRNIVVNRIESNEDIQKAADILERVGQYYAYDYILGLPRLPKAAQDGTVFPLSKDETIESFRKELMGFAEFIQPLKYCYRIAPFMISYMPGTELIKHGMNCGDLNEKEVRRLQKGLHDNYMAGGSVVIDQKRLRLLNGYRVMFRLMSFLSPAAKRNLINMKVYKIFWMAPFRVFITILDLMIAIRDKDAATYAKNYWWWFRKRFDKNYHLYYFKKRRKFEELDTPFQLPANGMLGTKTKNGWDLKT